MFGDIYDEGFEAGYQAGSVSRDYRAMVLREAVKDLLATASTPTAHSNTANVNAGALRRLRAALDHDQD